MLQGFFNWARRHPKVVDTCLATLPAILQELTTVHGWLVRSILTIAVCAPLIWRRRYPVAVLMWCYAIGLGQLVFNERATMSDFAIVIMIYTVAAYGPRWAATFAVVGGVGGGVLAVLEWTHALDSTDKLVGMAAIVAPVVLAWTIGENMRTRRAYFSELEERAARLEREQDAQARAAVAEERTRIARELHDVLAHSVGVIVVQSIGAEAALNDGELADVQTAIEAIGRTGRGALAELRLLLGAFREADADYVPQPGGSAIGDLLRQVPLPVRLQTEGTPRELPPGVGLAAYRIVQESLTNTIKHAGPGVSATVRLCYGDRSLEIHVVDEGSGPTGGEGGHGLVGMRERVTMFGGRLETGARPGGGFRVRAILPLEAGYGR